MASFGMPFGAAVVGRPRLPMATAATKSIGGTSSVGNSGGGGGGRGEGKNLIDWILGGLQKEDQLLETDPILQKADEKNGGATRSRGTTSVSVPANKKPGGFGGLFAKK